MNRRSFLGSILAAAAAPAIVRAGSLMRIVAPTLPEVVAINASPAWALDPSKYEFELIDLLKRRIDISLRIMSAHIAQDMYAPRKSGVMVPTDRLLC